MSCISGMFLDALSGLLQRSHNEWTHYLESVYLLIEMSRCSILKVY